MNQGKLGGKTKLTMKIAIPVIVILTALMIVATVLMNAFPNIMGSVFGYGTLHVEKDDSFNLTEQYYDYDCDSTAEAITYAQSVTREIVGEGVTLLKNEDKALPLSKGAGVTLFGYKTIDFKMSGGESISTTKGAVSFEVAMGYGQDAEGKSYEKFDVNPNTIDLYKANNKAADELTTDKYASIESSYAQYNSAAIVSFSRNSGEGNDQTIKVSGDNDRTGLSLSSYELALLEYVCSRPEFAKVVVVINASNAMEFGFLKDGGAYTDKYTGKTYDFSKVKAALWVGGVGSKGTLAVADVIDGTVNPSGRLTDTYVRDLTADPSYNNFGSYAYTNYDSAANSNYYATNTTNAYFVEYEEGIYVGYRYYETAAKEAADGNYAGFDYDKAVIYPFGHGLSYSNFTCSYEGTPSFDNEMNTYEFKVKVTNAAASEGGVKGKHTVMIFCNQPYQDGQVEKSHVVLAGFAKTDMIEPGASSTVTVSVDRDYLCSYDYKKEKCYVLDAGDYNFYLSDDSHSWSAIDKLGDTEKVKYLWTHNLSDKIVYNEDNKRASDATAAVNRFDEDANWKFKDTVQDGTGIATNFSRDNFKETYPTSPKNKDYEAEKETLENFEKYNADKYRTTTEKPVTENNAGTLQLVDMRGLDYDDPMWQTYIEQFTVESIYEMFRNGGWQTAEDEVNGVPKALDTDSPYGFYGFPVGITSAEQRNTWYQSEPVLAATFNLELARKMGDAIAEEGHKLGITGWYGPGANTHRNAMGGRNYEYYSEDGLLSGMMLAAECSGAAQKGMICYAKHAALNEQETNRQANGLTTWVNEQAIREIYLKPWEIYMKTASMTVKYFTNADGEWKTETKVMSAANGIMTSYNRIGSVAACHSTAMVVDVFRNEFGFRGISLTDCGGAAGNPAGSGDYMNPNDCLYSGATDLMLCNGGTNIEDPYSDTSIVTLQDVAHRILYNKANSNVLQQMQTVEGKKTVVTIYPGSTIWRDIAPWQIMLVVLWIIVGLIDAAGVALIALFTVKDLKKASVR